MTGRLTLLPPELQARLRSEVAVTSPAHCVEELVHNSIDAKATEIEVRIDLPCFKIQVTDNGCGIAKADLQHIGERYRTSKYFNGLDLLQSGPTTLGYRGEALASLINMCANVHILSKVKDDETTWLAPFYKGKRCDLAKSLIKSSIASSGTKVVLSNLLYNAPVRQMRISNTIDLEDIKYSVEALALAHPKLAISLVDDSSKARILSKDSSADPVLAFRSLFGREWNRRNLKQLHRERNRLTLEGIIASEGVGHKRKQFLFVNGRFIQNTQLHRIIQDILKQSVMCRPKIKRYNPASQQESPTKTSKIHPVYVLNLKCPIQSYDICLEPRKTQIEFQDWPDVTKFFKESILEFLEEFKLLPPDFDPTALEMSDGDEMPTTDFNEEPQISFDVTAISGILTLPPTQDTEEANLGPSSSFPNEPVFREKSKKRQSYLWEGEDVRQSKTVRREVEIGDRDEETVPSSPVASCSASTISTIGSPFGESKMAYQKTILPVGKTPFLPRKGKRMLLPIPKEVISKEPLSADSAPATLASQSEPDSKWKDGEQARSTQQTQVGPGVKTATAKEVLCNWKNPNFSYKEQVLDLAVTRKSRLKEAFRFDKAMLKAMTVLSQVDKKFIACTLTNAKKDKFLVLFDQHAVHERVRLEAVINENYPEGKGVLVSNLDLPIEISVHSDDARILERFQRKVKHFGLELDKFGDLTFKVIKAPECFVRREASELRNNRPSPLKDLILELAREICEILRTTRGGVSVLPRAIGNVLNSQACRTAIKFGDTLTVERCLWLLDQLKACQAPFQCAHGRPAAVPIVNVTKLEALLPYPSYKFNKAKVQAMMIEKKR